jgi:hypothetical protein
MNRKRSFASAFAVAGALAFGSSGAYAAPAPAPCPSRMVSCVCPLQTVGGGCLCVHEYEESGLPGLSVCVLKHASGVKPAT